MDESRRPVLSITGRDVWAAVLDRVASSIAPCAIVGDPRPIAAARAEQNLQSRVVMFWDAMNDRDISCEAASSLDGFFGTADYLHDLWLFERILDRTDYGGNLLSGPDKEAIFVQLLLFWMTKFSRGEADGFFGAESPHDPMSFTAYRVAQLSGCRVVLLQRLGPLIPAASARLGGIDGPRFRFESEDRPAREVEALLEAQERATEFVALAGSSTRMPYIQPRVSQFIRSRRDVSAVQNYEQGFVTELHYDATEINWARRRIREQPSRLRAALERESSRQLPSTFAYFALHYEPEKNVVPEGGDFANQLHAVSRARSFVPLDTAIVVAEHPTQFTRGTIARSPLLYGTIASLPNTILAHPESGSRELIGSASAVFSLTGTALVEAAVRGVPSISMGEPWFDGMPSIERFEHVDSWRDLTQSSGLSSSDDVRAWLLDLIWSYTIPFIPTPTHRSRIRFSAQSAVSEVGALARCISLTLGAKREDGLKQPQPNTP